MSSPVFDPKNFPGVHPDFLTSPVWRPGRAMSATDPARREWVDPALQFESAPEAAHSNKSIVHNTEFAKFST